MESTWKTAVAVNIHQLYPYNQPNRCLKKWYFPMFSRYIYIYFFFIRLFFRGFVIFGAFIFSRPPPSWFMNCERNDADRVCSNPSMITTTICISKSYIHHAQRLSHIYTIYCILSSVCTEFHYGYDDCILVMKVNYDNWTSPKELVSYGRSFPK